MAWNAANPASSSALTSSVIRDNWSALETSLGKLLSSAAGIASGRLSSDYTSLATTGSTETTLSTYSLGSSMLSVDGSAVRITAFGQTAATTNAKRIRGYFGSTVCGDSSSIVMNNYPWVSQWTVIRAGSSAQVSYGTFNTYTGLAVTPVVASPAEVLSGAVTITLTGLGVANGDITNTGLFVELLA